MDGENVKKRDRFNGVNVKNSGGFDDDEIKAYIKLAGEKSGGAISEISLMPADVPGKVKIEYVALHRSFERIRRITGLELAVCWQAA